ncbi:MAG: bifunctional nuclease family protein [Planctomycetes bacterium]|nr:bifunctional nuclease family protein [Planctomycetota bacterium]
MELSRILISELGDQQVIFLREKGGPRTFPILIGINEAMAIDRRIKAQATPRPMTHDLLGSVIEAMGGRITKIVITDIRDHTFIASIFIRRDNELIEIDSRPSDAIALGAAFDTPIFVSEHVLEEVLNESVSKEDKLQMLRERLEMLRDKIAELAAILEDVQDTSDASPEALAQNRKQLDEMRREYAAISELLKKLG